MTENKDKRTSEAKKEANQKNALVSTGPRTLDGKAVSSKNALKHGILSKELVITEGEGKEPVEVFNELREACFDYYQPDAAIETMLVDRVVACFWRMRRVIAYETGSIRMELDSLTERRKYAREAVMDRWETDANRSGYSSDYRIAVHNNSMGLKKIIGAMERAKTKILETGSLDDDSANKLINSCGYLYEHLVAGVVELARRMKYRSDDEIRDIAKKEREILTKHKKLDPRITDVRKIIKASLVSYIDLGLDWVKEQYEKVKKQEKMEDHAARLEANLPDQAALDKICRYEAHLERQLSKAMDQLEKYQRARLGPNTPPPLNLDLRVDNVTIRPGTKYERKPNNKEIT